MHQPVGGERGPDEDEAVQGLSQGRLLWYSVPIRALARAQDVVCCAFCVYGGEGCLCCRGLALNPLLPGMHLMRREIHLIMLIA